MSADESLARLRDLYEVKPEHVRPLYVTCVGCERAVLHERHGMCVECYEMWLEDFPVYAEHERMHPTPWQLERMVYGLPEVTS